MTTPRRTARDRADVERRDRSAQLAYAADARSGLMDLAGLVHAAEAAVGRLTARRGVAA